MNKIYCDITKDPNILEFVSMFAEFAEQHDAVLSFIICPLTGCDVHMGKDGDLESITIPKERLETIDIDTIRSVLNYLLTRLEALEQGTVLDKIREEIKEWYWQADKQALAKDPCVVDSMVDLFIRTIDKYKESEAIK